MKQKLNEILNKMNEIDYGYVFEDKDIYPKNDEDWNNAFSKYYHLLSPEEILKTKKGVCWDQVELERYYLELENIKCHSYFIVEYDDVEFPTHTFITVENNNKYYWLEHSWEPHRGIHEYAKEEELFEDIMTRFKKMLEKRNVDTNNIYIYQYSKPLFEISSNEFFKHCENGKRIIQSK